MLLAPPPLAQAVPDPATAMLGEWITPHRDGVFRIARCGDGLCGRLVGMRYVGAMPLDWMHRPQCGLLLLSGFAGAGTNGRWHGTILDPDTGHRYEATIWSPEPSLLKLRGYVLLPILGETQTWTRYDGTIGAACRLPTLPREF